MPETANTIKQELALELDFAGLAADAIAVLRDALASPHEPTRLRAEMGRRVSWNYL